jgi:hypothetical protein
MARRDGQRGGRGDHGDDVGLVLAIIGQNVRDAVDLVVETFGKERPDRAIDETAGKRLLFGRAALALEEAARDATRCRELFLIMTVSGKKSCPDLTLLAAVTAQSTTVSPRVASTAPSACRATRPVSRVSVLPPHSISTFLVSNI